MVKKLLSSGLILMTVMGLFNMPIFAADVLPAALTMESEPMIRTAERTFQMRSFTLPYTCSNAYFDAQGRVLNLITSDRSVQKVLATDAAGSLAVYADSQVVAGVNGKGGVDYGDNGLIVVDFWPDGGNPNGGLYNLSPSGAFSAVNTVTNHGGSHDIIDLPIANLFIPVASPYAVETQEDLQVGVLKSNFNMGRLGSIYYNDDGKLSVLSASPNHKRLASIDMNGNSQVQLESDVLVGANWRGASAYGNSVLVAVDYAPDTGNGYKGIYEIAKDGSYKAWTLSGTHDGMRDLIPAPDGGYYFTDFEQDNIWHITQNGTAETPMLESQGVPPAIVSIDYNEATDSLYALNYQPDQWWSSGGVHAVYDVSSGLADLVAEAPAGAQLYALAAAKGGVFGDDFYVTDYTNGIVYRIESDGRLTPVIEGLSKPTYIRFNPVNGDMAVVCDSEYILFFNGDVSDFGMTFTPKTTDGGWLISDFETDGIWHLPQVGQADYKVTETDIPPGLGTLAYNDVSQDLYALNWAGTGWPFGGENSAYKIHSNGTSEQIAKGDFTSLAMSSGNVFGQYIYLTNNSGNKIQMMDNDGKITDFITNIPKPTTIEFDPVLGNMAVLYNDGKSILWMGYNLGATTPITETDSKAGNASILVTWPVPANTVDLEGYNVYRTQMQGSYSDPAITDFLVLGNSYLDENVINDTTYYYQIKAVYKDGREIEIPGETVGEPAATALPFAPMGTLTLQVGNPMMIVGTDSKEIDPGRSTAPIIKNGRTLVPIRAIIEQVGGTVAWDGATQKVTLDLDGNRIELWIGSNKTMVNGVQKTTDVAPQIINGRTLLPLRFVSESFGLNVIWDSPTKKITIRY